MKSFSVSTKRQTVDEKNMVKTQSEKVLVRAEDPADAIYKAKEWLAENTEKGKDYEVLNCTGSSIKEIVDDQRQGSTRNYEIAVEYNVDNGKKGKRANIVVTSDTNAHASNKAEVYMGEKNPCRVVSCKESAFAAFIGFDKDVAE